MRETPHEQLAREIGEMPVKDEQDLLFFLPLAARLAALGNSAHLTRWPKLARELRTDIMRLLTERFYEGVWDLRHAVGQDLGLAVVAAQDFTCFWVLQKDILPAGITTLLESWGQEAEDTLLDEEAVETLERFIECFPLPEDMRLHLVDAPISSFAEAFLARGASARPTIEAEWPAAVPEDAGEVLMLDGGQPSDKLKDRIARETDIEISSQGGLCISRRLGDHWLYVLDITCSAQASRVESVRIGLLPALPASSDRTDRWFLDLHHLDIRRRLTVLNDPVVVTLQDGPRVRIT